MPGFVRVTAETVFPNCPLNVYKMGAAEWPVYAPPERHEPPAPEWKKQPDFREVLLPDAPAGAGA